MGLSEHSVRIKDHFNKYVSSCSIFFLFLSVESFERDNDLTNYNLSEFGYREIFFTPLIRSLFRGTHREMNIYL